MSLLKDIIERFIFLGADINCCDDDGWTALHHASAQGHIQMVWCLLQLGAKRDRESFDRETPLIVANRHRRSDIVKLLVYYEFTIGNYNLDGMEFVDYRYNVADEEYLKTVLVNAPTAEWVGMVHSLVNKATIDSNIILNKAILMLVAVRSDEDLSKLLINMGVVNSCDDNGWTALHHASSKGWFNMVWNFLQSGADKNIKNFKGETSLMLAVEQSNESVAKLLLHHGVDGPNFDGCDEWASKQLCDAVDSSWIEMVQWLINKGVDINSNGYLGKTPLMKAASGAQKDMAELLINAGADIKCCNHKGWTALHFAISGGSVEIVQHLVNKGADIYSKCDNRYPLEIAIGHNHIRMVELLFNLGASIEICSRSGRTLLHYAASVAGVEVVMFLVNKGVNIDSINVDGETPLILAVEAKNVAVVNLLMELGADIHCRSVRIKWTLLHHATHNGWMKIVKALVEKGADINARTYNGSTPLMLAIQRNTMDIAVYLLEQGADCNLKNCWGQSAFSDLSISLSDVKTIRLFIQKGGCVDSDCYSALMSRLEIQIFILKDKKLCSQIIINNFNNKYLPTLYKVYDNANRLPSIDKLKIREDCVEMVSQIEEAVACDIKRRVYCKVLEVRPLALSILSLQSFSKSFDTIAKQRNQVIKLM